MSVDFSETYPPLDQVRRTLRPQWYRCPIEPAKLRTLSKRSDRQGWIQAGGHLALYLLLCSTTVMFWVNNAWWGFFISLWSLGFVASYFSGTAVHELGHGTVFKTRRLNQFFLYLFSLIGWWDPFDYAASHTYHHRYTTFPQADRENLLPLIPSLHPWLLAQLLTMYLFSKPGRSYSKGGFFWTVYLTSRSALGIPVGHITISSQQWLQTLHKDQPMTFYRAMWWSRALLIFHGSVFLLAVFTGFWVLPLILTTPAYIARIGTYLTGTPQHCGLRDNVADFRKNTRSMTLNPLLEFLYWGMNWHTEHHMYANVPCYNLKSLAEEIKDDMPKPRTLFSAWAEMRTIFRRQQREPDYQFDTPVPTGSQQMSVAVDEQLVSSIGEIDVLK